MASRIEQWRDAVVRLLALAGRPVRRSQGRSGTVVEPYRGYGSRTEIFLIGRVFRQSAPGRRTGPDDVRTHLRDVARRIRRRRVAGASLTASFAGARATVETDRDGYFRLHMLLREPPPEDRAWHTVDIVLHTDPPVAAAAQVFIPSPACRFAVVSDIDDTVMRTGVANKFVMLWRLFVADADSRVAFPGVAALYRALHDGVGGREANPMLYVSRAPWGIYDMLTAFFRMHAIPVGPVLFLREWGLSWRHPLPRRAEDHKRALIDNMLALYPALPFVLIGDSGQHDPEVYAAIVEAHPGRVRAVYIRDVSRTTDRGAEIARLTRAIAAVGSHLVLASDSVAMAEHMAGIGLIGPDTVAAVADERSKPCDR